MPHFDPKHWTSVQLKSTIAVSQIGLIPVKSLLELEIDHTKMGVGFEWFIASWY